MTANAVSTFDASNDGETLLVEATTFLPADPTLLVFCCDYQLIPKTRMRGGEEVPHGNLLYMDCEPAQFAPTGGDGITNFVWEVPNSDYTPCQPCNLAIVEFGLVHPLDWTTQVHPCPPLPTGAVHFDGATIFISPGLSAPATFVISVSYWFRLAADQSSATFAESDSFGEQAYVEFFGGTNGPAVDLAQDPFPPMDGGLFLFSDGSAPALGVWHHVAYTANTAGGEGGKAALVMLDGVNTTSIDLDLGEGFLLPLPGFSYILGGDGFGNNTVCDLYDFWLALGQEVDFASPPVLQKFRTADGQPVDLGVAGELPTGTAPTIFGHGDAATFLQPNLGTGGDLALAGALSNTDGPPS